MLNLNPILTEDQPTSHVKIGESKIGNQEQIVKIQHNDRTAFFYADPVNDQIVDRIGNRIRINENVGEVFEGINRGKDFYVEGRISPSDIRRCESVKLYTSGKRGAVKQYLKKQEFLLHPIEEIIHLNERKITVEPMEISPSGYQTVRITEDTDIQFLSAEAYQNQQRQTPSQQSSTGAGQPERSNEARQQAEDNEEVDIHIEPQVPTVSFEEDVAGLPEVKRTARMLLSLFEPSVYNTVIDRYGEEFADRGNSMMLYGPPGCGKTLISEAIAYEAKHNTEIEENFGEVKFLEVKGSDILSKYSGEAEKRVEAAFQQAREIGRDGFAVLFFDEVETLVPDRSDDSLQRHERSLTNAFLQEMNEIEDKVLVIGATNMPFTIDPAASRRFPVQQFIPQPDSEVMAEVWRKHLSSIETADQIDYQQLGKASEGFTPAEIADRVLGSDFQRELVESVYRADRDPITPDTEYFLSTLEDHEPKTIRQYIASVRKQMDDLEGYPELQDYVTSQAEDLGISVGTNDSMLEQILSENNDESTTEPTEPTDEHDSESAEGEIDE